jgi:hypothetical protein
MEAFISNHPFGESKRHPLSQELFSEVNIKLTTSPTQEGIPEEDPHA